MGLMSILACSGVISFRWVGHMGLSAWVGFWDYYEPLEEH